MNLPSMAKFATIKGLNVLGTGDFTHPAWLREIETSLEEVQDSGLFALRNHDFPTRFMLTAEVYTNFRYKDKSRRIHHVIWAPSIDIVKQINDVLSAYGRLSSDGRPLLHCTPPQLVERLMQVSHDIFIFPAHAWTPWFGIFGAFSGFDNFEDCYQDESHHIFALETGLSSDPPMNWRLSSLDRLAILSNSDSHSSWPWRLGREATVLEIEQLSYSEILDAIKSRDPKRLLFTIETEPAYGKYHWSGHRGCGVSFSAREAMKRDNKCPSCGKRLTKGVEQRVEELADRSSGYRPRATPSYIHLLPLSEIIASQFGVANLSAQKVWSAYNPLVEKFGSEFKVLLDAPQNEMARLVGSELATAIVKVRLGKAKVIPGYDGVYGRLSPT